MLNGSCRRFSSFYDRLAVQRSLAEHLLREGVQHWSFWRSDYKSSSCLWHRLWLQQRRLWETCRFHFFRGICRDTILCRLVFFGDLWRHKKEHLVLASLRNDDFEKLCKIQLGISICCCLRALSVQMLFMTTILSGTCFAGIRIGIRFRITSQSPQHSLRLLPRALQPKWRERNHHKALCNDFGSWTHNWPFSNLFSS